MPSATCGWDAPGALAMVLLAIIFVITFINFRLLREDD